MIIYKENFDYKTRNMICRKLKDTTQKLILACVTHPNTPNFHTIHILRNTPPHFALNQQTPHQFFQCSNVIQSQIPNQTHQFRHHVLRSHGQKPSSLRRNHRRTSQNHLQRLSLDKLHPINHHHR